MSNAYPTKVYQIGNRNPRAATVKPAASGQRKVIALAPRRSYSNKSPAAAALFSAFLWGSGQAQADYAVMGLKYLLLQLVSATLYVALWFHAENIAQWQQGNGFSENYLMYGALAYSFAVGMIWYFQVLQAYRMTEEMRYERYDGSDSLAAVLFAAIVLPGGGQLINGQRRKSIFFLIAPALLLACALSSWAGVAFWPFLQEAETRTVIEGIWIGSSVVAVSTLLVWIVAAYDAAMINMYPEKREPFFRRTALAWNRFKIAFRRGQLLYGIQDFSKHLLMIAAALAVGFVLYSYIPSDYYISSLNPVIDELRNQQFILTPEVLNTLRVILGRFFL